MKNAGSNVYGWRTGKSVTDCQCTYGKESNAYMRDYVMDDETGSLKELHFKNSSQIIRIPQCRVLEILIIFETKESM